RPLAADHDQRVAEAHLGVERRAVRVFDQHVDVEAEGAFEPVQRGLGVLADHDRAEVGPPRIHQTSSSDVWIFRPVTRSISSPETTRTSWLKVQTWPS